MWTKMKSWSVVKVGKVDLEELRIGAATAEDLNLISLAGILRNAADEIERLRSKEMLVPDTLQNAIASVVAERRRQDAKWGEQNHIPALWMPILGEEYGELCQAVLETHFDNGPELRAKGGYENMRAEAVQVAAVAVAFVEYLDRQQAKQTTDPTPPQKPCVHGTYPEYCRFCKRENATAKGW